MALKAKLYRAYDLGVVAAAALAAPVPYRHRWRALRLIGRLLMPIARGIGRYRDDYAAEGLVTVEEYVFEFALMRATQLGLGFEPRLSHDGLEMLDEALASGKPVMLVGVHAMLLYLAGRYLMERGCDFIAPRSTFNPPVMGKPGSYYSYLPFDQSNAMLRLTRMMQPGRLITALIDGDRNGRRTIAVPIGAIDVPISYPLLKLGVDRGAAILFFHPRLIGDRVELRWRRADEANGLDGVIASLGEFLLDQTAARSITTKPPGAR
ncbi:hypothetical protein [Sphingomonas sp.]|uniref:hypothetical protein n=1 Tax=Sphingomonas sp. TaxID=28214 RepID=UPI002E340080|nr:hypothetical protein [Sphingomonas sp.]HEX4693853.1 hypothetical protein [Sphingomonas sp.]